ncbi:MAG: hypothetical protein Q7T80_06920 [Methanoregula sp.]|nr:hypothetical protein [Methanoregula sp.]
MRWQASVTLLLLCLLIPSALAADITFTAGQQDYYFLAGQPVEIPLSVTSTYPGDMPGTVRFSTDSQLQKTGVVMISTQNRVFTRTIPAGGSFLNLTMAPSQVSREYKVHISFYYTAPSPVNATIPEFFIHIVTDPGLVKYAAVPQESTSQPERGEIPTNSSVSIAEQTVSTRQQMGSDSAGQQVIASLQPQPDTPAAREQKQRDKEKREREQVEFDGRLETDPLFIAVNESLGAEGFTRQTFDTQPAGNDTGTFSMVYRKGAEDRVVVQGSMQGGVVPSVREASNAEITADPALVADTTFRSFNRTLKEQGYGHTETLINRTLTGTVANITYATPEGKKAYVNATIEANRVVMVTMEQETGPAGFVWIAISFLAIVILLVCGWFVYQKYGLHRLTVPTAPTGSRSPVFDHRKEAERLLNKAGLASDQHRYTDAYGQAGRALRVFLSYEYGNQGEVTTPEIVSMFRTSGRDAGDIEALLRCCDDVVFARQQPEDTELSSMIIRIREIIATT